MGRRILHAVAWACCMLALAGCATVTDPVHVRRSENEQLFMEVVAGKKVLILPPFVTTRMTATELSVTPESCGATSLAKLIEESAKGICQDAGGTMIVAGEDAATQADPADDAMQTLMSSGPTLMSYYKDRSALATSLQALGQATGAQMICAYSIDVKVGMTGGWNPNSGEIWQGTSSTSAKAVLVSTATGETVWGNEMFVRTVASDNQCIKAAKKLFIERDTKGGRQ